MRRRDLFRGLAVGTVAGAAAGAAIVRPALAQAVHPAAFALLEGMAQALAAARTLRFTATALIDGDPSGPTPDFTKLSTSASVLFSRPNRLRVHYAAPLDADLVGEGEKTTVYVPRLASKAPLVTGLFGLPPEVAVAYDALQLPFIDVIVDNPAGRFVQPLRTAQVVLTGLPIDGTTADVVFLATPAFTGEVWVGTADRLPRRMVGTWSKGLGRQPATASILYGGWMIDRPATDADLTPAGLAEAKTVPFADLWKR